MLESFPVARTAFATLASPVTIPPPPPDRPATSSASAAAAEHADRRGQQSVYFFGDGTAEGTRDMKRVLGGKGANLAEMTNLGVPVPPGFTIACAVCVEFLDERRVSRRAARGGRRNLARLEEATGKKLRRCQRIPLLVSVRSGAPVSMPGMMETILNLGLNDRTVDGSRASRAATRASRTTRIAASSRCTATSCSACPFSNFEHLLAAKRLTAGVATDAELAEDALRNLVEEYKALVRNTTGADFPTDPVAQLWGAIEAVWKSWTLKKAVDYRRVHAHPGDARHGRQRRLDGVRQPRRRLRHRRRLHARIRRPASSASTASSSSTRRARTSSPASARRSSIDEMASELPGRLHGAARHAGAARAALPRHAGHRVHGRARQAVPAADAHRQAHRGGRGAHRDATWWTKG